MGVTGPKILEIFAVNEISRMAKRYNDPLKKMIPKNINTAAKLNILIFLPAKNIPIKSIPNA